MDIDEFLDRELADLARGSSSSDLQSSSQPEQQDTGDSSTLLESTKSSLDKGNLEEAEKFYLQLWHALMQQKLKWDKGIYDQISALNRQFLSTLEQAFNEAKSKSAQINDLIGKARSALKDKKKDAAIKIYGQAQEINNSIPNVFFEEKKLIKDQIEEFYKELSSVTENELIQKVAELVQQINSILERISASVSSNNLAAAASEYYKSIDLYNRIPEGFLRQKNPLGAKVLEIYKSLSISAEIYKLRNQLGSMPIIPRAPGRSYSPAASYAELEKYSSPRSDVGASFQRKIWDAPHEVSSAPSTLKEKMDLAKRNIKKGFYNEARKNIEEALAISPGDAEAITLKAKIKTLQ